MSTYAHRLLSRTIAILTISQTALCQTPIWQQTNGPFAVMSCILVSDSLGNMYVGTEGNGFYRSTNGGATWARLPLDCITKTIAIKNQGYVFVGTGDGLYRSTDSGSSWTRSDSGTVVPLFSDIVIDSSGAVYACGIQSFPNRLGKLYRSTDDGSCWSEIYSNDSSWVYAIATDSHGSLLVKTDYGIFRSTDLGQTWSFVDIPPCYSIVNSRTGEIYAAVVGAILRSTDGGDSWLTARVDSIPYTFLTFDRLNNVYVAAKWHYLLKSTDSGNTWLESSTPQGQYVTSLFPTSERVLYAGTDLLGVYKTTDNGLTWSTGNFGMRQAPFSQLASNPNNVVSGIETWMQYDRASVGGGVFRTTDSGDSWIASNYTYFGPYSIASRGHNVVYGSDHVNYSSDDGISWLPIGEYSLEIFSLAIDANAIIYAAAMKGSEGNYYTYLFRSNDTGRTWVLLPSIPPGRVAVSTRGTLFVTSGNLFSRSLDSGFTWATLQFDASQLFVNKVVTGAPDEVYLATSHGVFFSPDTGNTWQKLSVGLSDSSIRSVAISEEGILFAGSNAGRVFRLLPGSVRWELYSSGLDAGAINDLTIDSFGYLYAATDNGVFRTLHTITSVKERSTIVPTNVLLEQNFPNPFNPSTTIRYALPRKLHATLTVFNILGQQVASLVDGDQEAGYHEVQFNGSGLASGVYFYRIQAGRFVETRKLLLVR
jgi:photosystem II stability/assembly factor-like uncharacterized protein